MEATITALAGMVELRDPYTAGHQRNVSLLAAAIARDMGLSQHDIEGIRLAGVVHDVGKINVPAEILSKPGKLATAEFEIIKTHAQAGYDVVKGVDFPWPVAQMILQHHERLDGSGYPNGLEGDAIVIGARILAVADVVEAMMARRPYREALGLDAAMAEIEAEKGTRYDPAAVDVCLALFRENQFGFPAVSRRANCTEVADAHLALAQPQAADRQLMKGQGTGNGASIDRRTWSQGDPEPKSVAHLPHSCVSA